MAVHLPEMNKGAAEVKLALREGLEFPFRGKRWPQRLALGGVLSALPLLIFVLSGHRLDVLKSAAISLPFYVIYFFVWGYAFGVFRAGFHHQAAELAAWRHWGNLFTKGLLAFLIGLGYGLFPLLIMALGTGVLYRGGWWLFTGMLLVLIGMLSFLLVGLFLPMGVAQYVRWNRIEAAFHFPSLWRSIRQILVEYVSLFLLSLFVLLVLGFLATIPLLGPPLASLLSFYPLVVLAKLFGEVCGLCLGEERPST